MVAINEESYKKKVIRLQRLRKVDGGFNQTGEIFEDRGGGLDDGVVGGLVAGKQVDGGQADQP